mgnify:CR=1 FL=1
MGGQSFVRYHRGIDFFFLIAEHIVKMSQYPSALHPSADDIKKMLACQVHFGTRNLDPNMERYIWKRRSDGVYLTCELRV